MATFPIPLVLSILLMLNLSRRLPLLSMEVSMLLALMSVLM